MLINMLVSKRDEVTGERRRLHNKEIYSLHSLPNITQIKKTEMGRECSTYVGEERCTGLVGKAEERRPFARPRRRWEDNIKMDLREVEWRHGVDLSGSG